MLRKDREDKKLPERSIDMIILLTDGMPNSGMSVHSNRTNTGCERPFHGFTVLY